MKKLTCLNCYHAGDVEDSCLYDCEFGDDICKSYALFFNRRFDYALFNKRQERHVMADHFYMFEYTLTPCPFRLHYLV